MTSWRNASGAAAAVAVLVGAAACGPAGGAASHGATAPAVSGGSTRTDALQVLDSVEKRTSATHSAKVELTMSVGGAQSIRSTGEMDWSHGLRSAMTTTQTGGTAARTLANAGVEGPIQVRYLPDGFYLDLGPTLAADLGGKHWVRYPLAELAELGNGQTSLGGQAQEDDPARVVRSILASKDVRKVGTESVRGVRAVRYAGTVHAAEITGSASRYLTSAQAAEMRRALKNAGITTENVDLWIDADHHVVKAVSSAETQRGEMHTTVFYSDFGVPVHVTAPPASDSMDFTDMLKTLMKNH